MGTTYGTAGNDTINVSTWSATWSVYGYGGNDTITISNSFISSVVISGGAGNDIINVPQAQSVNIHGDEGNDTIMLNGSTSAGSRHIYGDIGDDTIYGTIDDDYIYGGADNDILWGRQGADHIYGDGGDDTIIANLAYQSAVYDGGTGYDKLIINPDSAYTAYQVNIQSLSGIEEIMNTDLIKDAFLSGNGLDLRDIKLIGINGVVGTNGNDLVRAGVSKEANGTPIDMQLKGLGGNDSLRGYNGDDLLHGGTGNDQLYGFLGEDELYGEAGNDEFHLTGDWGIDKIMDFQQGQDLIYLHMTGLTDISGMATEVDEDGYLKVDIGNIEFKIQNGSDLALADSDFVFVETRVLY